MPIVKERKAIAKVGMSGWATLSLYGGVSSIIE